FKYGPPALPVRPGPDVLRPGDSGDGLRRPPRLREVDAGGQVVDRSRSVHRQLPGRADPRFQSFLGRATRHRSTLLGRQDPFTISELSGRSARIWIRICGDGGALHPRLQLSLSAATQGEMLSELV